MSSCKGVSRGYEGLAVVASAVVVDRSSLFSYQWMIEGCLWQAGGAGYEYVFFIGFLIFAAAAEVRYESRVTYIQILQLHTQ